MKEIWRPIKNYEHLYLVSNLGNVKSLHKRYKNKILKAGLAGNGYLTVALYKDFKSKTHTVHRLVAEHFLENPSNKKCIHHINGNKLDNKCSNLKFVTHKENNHFALLDGHRKTKLTSDDIIFIRELYSSGSFIQAQLARMFSIDKATARSIVLNKIWKHVK